MIGQPLQTTHRYAAAIVTVDPTQSIVDGILKSGSAIRISVYTTGAAFRWPVVGESWIVRQENGSWYLESLLPPASFQTAAPGDAIINSPTGQIRVLGSKTGTTDFNIAQANVVTNPVAGTAAGIVIGRPARYRRAGAYTTAQYFNPFLLDTQLKDDDGLFVLNSGVYVFAAPADGWYQFNAAFESGGVATGTRGFISLMQTNANGTLPGGATEYARGTDSTTGGATELGLTVTAKLYLTAGTRLAPSVWTSVPVAFDVAGSHLNYCDAQRVA